MLKILVNQIGYVSGDRKRVIVESDGEAVDSLLLFKSATIKKSLRGL